MLDLSKLTRAEKLEFLALLEERERRKARRKIDGMFPATGPLRRELYPKHMEHMRRGASHRERLFMAANRVGKTTTGAYESTLHLTGDYPDWWEGKRFDGPVRWWASGKTNETTRDIVQAELMGAVKHVDGRREFTGTGMIPGDWIGPVNWKQGVNDLADRIQVKHVTGGWSDLGMKSYNQGRGSFEGTAREGIWLDEEPDLDVYAECLMRTMTTDGLVIVTFTPLGGWSEVVSSFLENGKMPDDE